MSDSEYKIRITAEVREALDAMAKAKGGLADIDKAGKSAVGPMLHLAGSTRALSNGLGSLAGGKGGAGALLQVASSSRGALTALRALGGGGAAAAGGLAVGVAAVTAAIALTGAEIAKTQMGTENWAKASVGFINKVAEGWNGLMTGIGEWWDQTAVGSIMKEYSDQQKAAELAATKERIDEQRRLNELTGDALENEVRSAEAAGDAVKYGALYNKLLDERAKHADERGRQISPVSDENRAVSERLDREGAAVSTAARIGEQEDSLSNSQSQRLSRAVDNAVRNRAQNVRVFSEYVWQGGNRLNDLGEAEEARAMGQLEKAIAALAADGVSAEKILSELWSTGKFGDDEIVAMLEKVRDSSDRIPREFAAELSRHFRPGVIAWQ